MAGGHSSIILDFHSSALFQLFVFVTPPYLLAHHYKYEVKPNHANKILHIRFHCLQKESNMHKSENLNKYFRKTNISVICSVNSTNFTVFLI